MTAIEYLRDGLRDVMKATSLDQARGIAREALRNWHRTPTLDDDAPPAGWTPYDAEELALVDPKAASLRGTARVSDPAESSDAALANLPRQGSQRERCLMAVRAAGPDGMTASEVEDVTEIPVTSTAKRLGELERGGWIKRKRWNGRVETRTTKRGARGAVYVLTPQAVEELHG